MLHHVRRGRGEPLFLIQGMSGTHLAWGERFLALLEKDFDVVTYDHRGIGGSPRANGPFSIADLADDAAALIETVGWTKPHVVGISMGGMVAQELAIRHPESIATLTLGCTFAGGANAVMTPEDVVKELGAALTSGDIARAIKTSYGFNVSAEYATDPAHYEEFYAMATSSAARPRLETIMLQMQAIGQFDTSDRLGAIQHDTLVIHGTADRMMPVENAHVLAAQIPHAKLELLPGVGHLFFWEQAEKSAALIKAHARLR